MKLEPRVSTEAKAGERRNQGRKAAFTLKTVGNPQGF